MTVIITVNGIPTRAVQLQRQRERDALVHEDTLRQESLEEQELDLDANFRQRYVMGVDQEFVERYAEFRRHQREVNAQASSDIRGVADWVQQYTQGGRFAAG